MNAKDLDKAVAYLEGRAMREPVNATDADVEHLPVPFTLYEVTSTWVGDLCRSAEVKPITVTRYGVDVEVGATAPSISFTDASNRRARGSVSMFYLTKVEAELEVRACTKGTLAGFHPSTDWAQGGPIIEREGITLAKGNPILFTDGTREDLWIAKLHGNKAHGPTPLIAAMRAFVTSKFPNGITTPEELAK